MAKKCVAAIARELEICQDFEVRNNCVLILCDLCVRWVSFLCYHLKVKPRQSNDWHQQVVLNSLL